MRKNKKSVKRCRSATCNVPNAHLRAANRRLVALSRMRNVNLAHSRLHGCLLCDRQPVKYDCKIEDVFQCICTLAHVRCRCVSRDGSSKFSVTRRAARNFSNVTSPLRGTFERLSFAQDSARSHRDDALILRHARTCQYRVSFVYSSPIVLYASHTSIART